MSVIPDSYADGVRYTAESAEVIRSLGGIYASYGKGRGASAVVYRAPGVISGMGKIGEIYGRGFDGIDPAKVSEVERSVGMTYAGMGQMVSQAGNIAVLATGSPAMARAAQMASTVMTTAATVQRAWDRFQKVINKPDVTRRVGGPGSTKPGAAGANGRPHLLILSGDAGTYYFNLTTAAYHSLRRETIYGIAVLERLSRRPAIQFVHAGTDLVTVEGAVFGAFKGGAGQLAKLRGLGGPVKPFTLTTGYGEVLGRYYLTRIEEQQDALMPDGAPRKQAFTLEFQRDADDYQNL
jgi:phage protein U